jgi:hypothetical protein
MSANARDGPDAAVHEVDGAEVAGQARPGLAHHRIEACASRSSSTPAASPTTSGRRRGVEQIEDYGDASMFPVYAGT